MNPNAATFTPRSATPLPSAPGKFPAQTPSRPSRKGPEPRPRKHSKPEEPKKEPKAVEPANEPKQEKNGVTPKDEPKNADPNKEPGALDPSNYDNMFPPFRPLTQNLPRSRRGSKGALKGKKTKKSAKHAALKVEASSTMGSSLVPGSVCDLLDIDTTDELEADEPSQVEELEKPNNEALQGLVVQKSGVAGKNAQPTSVEKKTPASTSSAVPKTKSIPITKIPIEVGPCLPPTPRYDNRVTMNPRGGHRGQNSKRRTASASFGRRYPTPSVQAHPPAFPRQFGFPRTTTPANGSFGYPPQQAPPFSPACIPMPHYTMPTYQYPVPQGQGQMGQPGWEGPVPQPGPAWQPQLPPTPFGSPPVPHWATMNLHPGQASVEGFWIPMNTQLQGQGHRLQGWQPQNMDILRPSSVPVKKATLSFGAPAPGSYPGSHRPVPAPGQPTPPRNGFVGRSGGPPSQQPHLVAKWATQQIGLRAEDEGQREVPPVRDQVVGTAHQTGQGQSTPVSLVARLTTPRSQYSTPQKFAVLQKDETGSPIQGVPKGPKSGSWSQSKRWVSQEAKERTMFHRLLLSLHYMNADKSPALPQTPAELTAFKAELERIKLDKEVQKKQLAKSNEKDAGDGQLVLFRGKRLPDKLSPVFGVVTCFDGEPEKKEGLRVQWPTMAELKEDGDKRSYAFDRCLPLPRLDLLSIRLPPGLPTSRQSLKNKKVSVVPRSLPPLNPPDLDESDESDASDTSDSSSDYGEVDESDLAPSLKQILNLIEGIEEKDEDLDKEEADEEIKEANEAKKTKEAKEAKEAKEEVKAGDEATNGT